MSRQLQSFKTVMFTHFIVNVLEECSIVSHVFQRDTSTITIVCKDRERVEHGVSVMIGRPAQHLCAFWKTV